MGAVNKREEGLPLTRHAEDLFTVSLKKKEEKMCTIIDTGGRAFCQTSVRASACCVFYLLINNWWHVAIVSHSYVQREYESMIKYDGQ